jgi:hypothetical protein
VTSHRWQGGDGGSLRIFEPGSDELEERVELSKLMTTTMLAALNETGVLHAFRQPTEGGSCSAVLCGRGEDLFKTYLDNNPSCSQVSNQRSLAKRVDEYHTSSGHFDQQR